MRIGILTITPSVGFGGILQAYALRYILEQMGHSVQIINYTTNSSLKNKLTYFAKSLIKKFNGEFVKYSPQAELRYRSQNIIPFIKDNLNFSKKVTSSTQLKHLINTSYDIVIAGSDQVWRPKYVHGIENYFFAGVKQRIKRIAYAASFGVDSFEYSEEEAWACSNLLKCFTYVSVREQSGVKLLKDNLRYEKHVFCDLDPTMLAGLSAFQSFILSTNKSKDKVFSYILDPTDKKKMLLDEVARILDKSICNFNTNAENPNKPLNERIAPPVEDWVNGIFHSSFVVTDSFHGCAFSILFNKPFIVYVNKNRGSERFTSILSQFNLCDRMIENFDEFDPNLLKREIDWENINKSLINQRIEILNRLKIAINQY